MRTVVLTYHSINILGNDYANNDHVALAADLAFLARSGIDVVPLREVVAQLDQPHSPKRNVVAISFDDGSWFDWFPLEHPTCGLQPSFADLLRPHRAAATSFVIASPGARTVLDSTCMIGKGWWTDEWWAHAEREGLIAIENHSWDHNHETLPSTVLGSAAQGTFRSVLDRAGAEAEIEQATRFIQSLCGSAAGRLLAYPYGEYTDFLVEDYLPAQSSVVAAFTTEPRPVSAGDDRWRLGRYVCGFHWKSPEQLSELLRDAFAA